MKQTYSLLIGNDINNINNPYSWKSLLAEMISFCGLSPETINFEQKPFPLLYEEIFLNAARKNNLKESELKQFIAQKVQSIEQNRIHQKIKALPVEHIMTTNYEFSLENTDQLKNKGIVRETRYSVFRHFETEGKKIWHLHGDANTPASINLGFEHYGGQLQQIRNYTVSGTLYKNKSLPKIPLIRRITNDAIQLHSWIDLFFTTDIFILGLNLDFVETDLWWLITYRARSQQLEKVNIDNRIFYFIPEHKMEVSKAKLDLLRANGIEIIAIDEEDKEIYYSIAIERIKEYKEEPVLV